MKDSVEALREVIPAKSYAEFLLSKEEVKKDDVTYVVLAAPFHLLELTEGKSGQGLTGAEIFEVNSLKEATSRSREGSLHDSDDSTPSQLPLTQDTAM